MLNFLSKGIGCLFGIVITIICIVIIVILINVLLSVDYISVRNDFIQWLDNLKNSLANSKLY